MKRPIGYPRSEWFAMPREKRSRIRFTDYRAWSVRAKQQRLAFKEHMLALIYGTPGTALTPP